MAVRIIKTGTWLYDGSVAKPVDIIGLRYDFWYEIAKADDQLEPGEQPDLLSPEGFIYYVRFRHVGETSEPTWVDSVGHPTVEAAMREAERKVARPIVWTLVAS